MQKILFFICFFAWVGIFHSLNAQNLQILQKKHIQVEFLSEQASLVPGQNFWLAIRFQIEPHWHIYWQNPGDTGVPPSVKWILPEGIDAGPLLWPTPERIEDVSLVNYAYEGTVVFLIEMKSATTLSGDEVTLTAQVDWLVCKDICIHEGTSLSLKLPLKKELPELNSSEKILFEKARSKLPGRLPNWTFQAKMNLKSIVIDITPPADFSETLLNLYFFPQEGGIIEDSAPQSVHKTETAYQLTLIRSIVVGKETPLLQGILIFTQNEQKKTFQVQIPVSF